MERKRFRFGVVWLLVAGLGAACASYQRVGIESTPSGAAVFVDGDEVGVTPMVVRVSTADHHKVYLKLPGYRPKLVVLNRHEPTDNIDFVTPADVRVSLIPEVGAEERDVDVRVEPEAP